MGATAGSYSALPGATNKIPTSNLNDFNHNGYERGGLGGSGDHFGVSERARDLGAIGAPVPSLQQQQYVTTSQFQHPSAAQHATQQQQIRSEINVVAGLCRITFHPAPHLNTNWSSNFYEQHKLSSRLQQQQ